MIINNILNLMIDTKTTTEDLANYLNISKNQMENYILMNESIPNDIVKKLATYFGCSKEQVLDASL